MLSSREKRGWLRIFYAQAQTASRTLLAQLELILQEAGEAQPAGQAIAATAANDHSTQFALSTDAGPGPRGMLELAEELIRRHDIAAAALVAAGNATPTDLQIRDAMLDAIVAVRDIKPDFSCLVP